MNLLEAVLILTLNAYHEARGESTIGQVAVTQVVLNRTRESNLSVPEVVYKPAQFSWTSDDLPDLPTDMEAFMECLYSVTLAVQMEDVTGGATHYHSVKVHPKWSDHLTYTTQYGGHKFYRK